MTVNCSLIWNMQFRVCWVLSAWAVSNTFRGRMESSAWTQGGHAVSYSTQYFVSLQYHLFESLYMHWFSRSKDKLYLGITLCILLHSRLLLLIMINVINLKQKSFLDTGQTTTKHHYCSEADLTWVVLMYRWLLVWELVLVSCFPYGGDYIALCQAFILRVLSLLFQIVCT